jgi:hypothetical protein
MTPAPRAWLARWGVPIACAVAVAGLVGHAAAARLEFLRSSPYPLGVDGYYYAIQLRSLLETGHLAYPASPLVFWLFAPLAAATDPIVGAKIGAALITALIAVPAYLLGKRLSGLRAGGLLAAALAAQSAIGFYLATEFVKQGAGLTAAAAFLAALAAAIERPTRPRLALAALLLLACAATHKTALLFAVGLGAPAAIARFAAADAAVRRRRLLVVAAAGLSLLAAVLLLGALFPGRFPALGELGLLAHTVRAHADLRLPVLAARGAPPLVFRHEVTWTVGLALLCLGAWLVERRRGAVLPPLAWGLLGAALLLGLPWLDARDEQGLAMRLRLGAVLLFPPLGALALALVGRRLAVATRACAALGVAAGFLVLLPAASSEGTLAAHPALVTASRALAGALPEDAVVVTQERHLLFMVAYHARVRACLHPPAGVPEERLYRLFPGALLRRELRAALDDLRAHPDPTLAPPLDLHPWAVDGLVLVSERTYQVLLGRLPEAARAHYLRWPVH